MFICPIELSLVNATGTWQDHAANPHFKLQSRNKAKGIVNLFTGLTSIVSTSNSVSSKDAYIKSLLEYDFRIILKTSKKEYLIAVDDLFEKIHQDWNWVEGNLVSKLAEIDSSKQKQMTDLIDAELLAHFEEMTIDSQGVSGEHGTANQLRLDFASSFPQLSDEIPLFASPCTYLPNEKITCKGHLYLTRNFVCFSKSVQDQPTQQDTESAIIPYKDIISLDIDPSNRLLLPDCIKVGIKNKIMYMFSMNFNRKECYRMIAALSSAAMHRLIKGAETAASLDISAKQHINGDLSNTIQKGSAALMQAIRSRDELNFTKAAKRPDVVDILEEEDFTQALITTPSKTSMNFNFESNSREASVHSLADITSTAASSKMDLTDNAQMFSYSYIQPTEIFSSQELENQIRQIEFRRLFKLSVDEHMMNEETGCTFFNRCSGEAFTGTLFLSNTCFHFVSTFGANGNINRSGGVQPGPIYPSLSALFETGPEPLLLFSVPFSHIVLVKKQPPTASPWPGKLGSFSLSGYLKIQTKNKQEIWMSFSTLKGRDKWSDLFLDSMKTVDWAFDQKLIVGERKIMISDNKRTKSSITKPSRTSSNAGRTRLGSISTNLSIQNDDEEINDEAILSDMEDLTPFLEDVTSSIKIFNVPLSSVFGFVHPLSNNEINNTGEWKIVLDSYGSDLCIIKDFKFFRELMIKTGGIPDCYRGDFWMLTSGAWNSQPLIERYYHRVLSDNEKKTSLFAEEIEKDVRRSLPEYSAYQSPKGLDTLRRVLTAYTFRNPVIGYAQALNIISAVILIYLKEEDAFWMLCNIVEKILPDHYTKTLVGSVVDQQVFSTIVQFALPELHAHLSKNYIDIKTYAVPWFVCLYLNTASLRCALRILDGFFLDGPKFLFWFGLSVLKVNEAKLMSKRDDEAFMSYLKDFFFRLGKEDSDRQVSDLNFMTGVPLYQHVLTVAYSFSNNFITDDLLESLRMRFRLPVVHQMEDSYRKSQIRNICEDLKLTFDEVGLIYDMTRQFEFEREELERRMELSAAEAKTMIDTFFERGGWGLIQFPLRREAGEMRKQAWMKTTADKKAVQLFEFRKLFRRVAPWCCRNMDMAHHVPLPTNRRMTTMLAYASKRESIFQTARMSLRPDLNITSIGQNTANTRAKSEGDQFNPVSIADRVYYYCAFLHNKQVSRENPLGDGAYTVNLGGFAQVLDTMMKQPLQTKLRLLFDLHDVDGDGALSKEELKETMDSLLEMFEGKKDSAQRDEEVFLRAVSAFLNTALKSGKGMDPVSIAGEGTGISTLSSVTSTKNNEEDSYGVKKLPNRGRTTSVALDDGSSFRLGFNEFLLSIMSQSVFVEFFEKSWKLKRDIASGRVALEVA